MPLLDSIFAAIFADDIAIVPLQSGARGVTALNKALVAINYWSREWHVNFSLLKSMYMLFSSRRSLPPISILLGSTALPRSLSFPYLGATLQPNLRWHTHCNRVISGAFKAAHEVARIIIAQGPSPRIIRQLALANVLPIITYGWPLWTPPTERHWAKLECAFCLPLRRCLSLPPNVHRLAVLVEFGLPNLRLLHQELAISYAHRLVNQPDGHLARVLLLEQYARPIQTSLNHLTSFGSYLKQAEARFNFDHSEQIPAFKRSLRSRSLSMQIDQLRKCEYSRILRNVSIHPSPCSYIKLDQRPSAILRARLRLNRNHLNYTKFRCKDVTVSSLPIMSPLG